MNSFSWHIFVLYTERVFIPYIGMNTFSVYNTKYVNLTYFNINAEVHLCHVINLYHACNVYFFQPAENQMNIKCIFA